MRQEITLQEASDAMLTLPADLEITIGTNQGNQTVNAHVYAKALQRGFAKNALDPEQLCVFDSDAILTSKPKPQLVQIGGID